MLRSYLFIEYEWKSRIHPSRRQKTLTYFLLVLSDQNVFVVNNHSLQKVFRTWHILVDESPAVGLLLSLSLIALGNPLLAGDGRKWYPTTCYVCALLWATLLLGFSRQYLLPCHLLRWVNGIAASGINLIRALNRTDFKRVHRVTDFVGHGAIISFFVWQVPACRKN